MGYPWGLSIRNAGTQTFATSDSLKVRNVSIQARLTPSGSTHIHDETQWTSVDTWWATGGWGNLPAASTTRMPDAMGLNDLSDLNNPDPRLADGSEAIGSADFSDPYLADCVVTSYRGAFPPVNGSLAPGSHAATAELNELWTHYWTNFDPMNTDYSSGVPSAAGKDPVPPATLAQNYPNPFNPQTTIDFVVPTAGQVSLEVFDVHGAKVATLVDGVKAAGKYSLTFNANGLASGVYFYRFRGNGFAEMHKMVLLK
jgi:hypothetical protein